MNWRKTIGRGSADGNRANLSFEGDGKVSVSVASIVNSPRVQSQVKAAKEIAAAARQAAAKK